MVENKWENVDETKRCDLPLEERTSGADVNLRLSNPVFSCAGVLSPGISRSQWSSDRELAEATDTSEELDKVRPGIASRLVREK